MNILHTHWRTKMGSHYQIVSFHIDEGKKYHGGYENILPALLKLWRLYRMKYYGCLYLEIRS